MIFESALKKCHREKTALLSRVVSVVLFAKIIEMSKEQIA